MEWYGPLTILPAIGLLILSTSNFIISLNNEIFELEKDKDQYKEVILSKITQLKKLGVANACLYASALLFMVAGIFKAFMASETLFFLLMLTGVVSATIGLAFLFFHSLKSVQIRHKHLKL